MYKTILILMLSIISHSLAFSQEEEKILSTPEGWPVELIPFPLNFAPSIDFVGVEDIRFAPAWSDTTSQTLWTYTFVWYIDKDEPMTESRLAELVENYYDGLMRVGTEGAPTAKETLAVFIKTDEGFSGRIRVYDNFFTKEEMILHVKVREDFCEASNKQLVLFELSPKAFDDPVWEMFEQVKLVVACE